MAKSDVVTTLTLVAKILRKSLQSDMGRWPTKLVLRISASLWKAKTNMTSGTIIWVTAPTGLKNVMSLFISPFIFFWWLPFSEISDTPAGSGATDSQDAIRLFPMSQAGPNLHPWAMMGTLRVCVGESEYAHRNGDNPDCHGPWSAGTCCPTSSRIPDTENVLQFLLTRFLVMTLGWGAREVWSSRRPIERKQGFRDWKRKPFPSLGQKKKNSFFRKQSSK